MTRIESFSLDYYNKKVIQRIMDKYGMEQMDAARAFLTSETHDMLENADMAMWEFPERAIFDMWEAEENTGDLRPCIKGVNEMTEEMKFFLLLVSMHGSHRIM